MKSVWFAGRAVLDGVLGGDTGRYRCLAVRSPDRVYWGAIPTAEGRNVGELKGIESYDF